MSRLASIAFVAWVLALAACGGRDPGSTADATQGTPTTDASVDAAAAASSAPIERSVGGVGPADEAKAATDAAPRGSVFYVSGRSGNDAGPGTRSRPWKSLARVQRAIGESALAAGDAVLFERGSRYAGTLTLASTVQGMVDKPVIFGAYGRGGEAVIDGTRAIGDWRAAGSGRWQAVCADCATIPSLLRLDGKLQAIARWPNADESGNGADRGYRYYTATNGATSITDPGLPATIDWRGGELVTRSIAWILDRRAIVAQSPGGNLQLGPPPSSYALELGWGYFIQNHPAAIDREGEWAFDAATRTITMQSATNPNQRRVEVTTDVDLLSVQGARHVIVRDLVIEGATRGVWAANCTSITLERLRVSMVGRVGIELEACENAVVKDSVVQGSANNGVFSWRCPGCRVLDTTIEQIGQTAGMGASGDGAYVGIIFGGDVGKPAELRRLRVRDIGYIGIDLRFAATLAQSHVSAFNQAKNDGAGIYTWSTTDLEIVDNTVLDAPGSDAGIPWGSAATHGIYIDDNSERVVVARNTVGRVGASGIYLHNTRDVELSDNLVFDAGEAGVLMTDDALGSAAVEATRMRANSVVVAGVPQLLAWSSSTDTFFDTLGTIDANVYCDPFAAPFVSAGTPATAGPRPASIATWRSTYGRDSTTKLCPERQPSFTVVGAPGADLVANGRFDSDLSGWFGWPDDTLDARWESGRLDGGSLRLGFAGSAPRVHFDQVIGGVTQGQGYLLEWSDIGIASEPIVELYLRQAGPPYERLTNTVTTIAAGERGEHAVLLQATRSDADSFFIVEMARAGTTIGIDNVRLRPVKATRRTLSDAARFEVNPSPAARSFTLDRPHATLDGRVLAAGASVTLEPYRSVVLFRR